MTISERSRRPSTSRTSAYGESSPGRYLKHRPEGYVVTRSRVHTVRYKLALDKYLAERGYAFKALFAFSGKVEDGGQSYTESSMNGFPEAQTAKTFERQEYRFLIAANKFQTGFDQPLLHTMYVDRKLGGVTAVQTLSRLNRTLAPQKTGTMVLDFANESDEIKAAFEPFYETTLLSEATNPNLLSTRRRGSEPSRSLPRRTSMRSPTSAHGEPASRAFHSQRRSSQTSSTQMRRRLAWDARAYPDLGSPAHGLNDRAERHPLPENLHPNFPTEQLT